MSLETLAERLALTDIPVTYRAWPEGEAPGLPYVCYRTAGDNPTFADGQVYYSYSDVLVELYTSVKSPEEERKVESALAGFHWKKNESYITDQRCYRIEYEIEV